MSAETNSIHRLPDKLPRSGKPNCALLLIHNCFGASYLRIAP